MRYTPNLLSYNMETITEIWLPIVGYEDRYQVSNTGKVKAIARMEFMPWQKTHRKINERTMRIYQKDNKYLFVTLSDGGGRKTQRPRYIHRLVAQSFIGNIPKGYVVNHLDGNVLNNCVENLEIVSQRDNCLHGLNKRKKSSKYPGVHLERKTGKWKVMARTGDKKLYLGKFNSEDAAYEVYKSFVESLEKTALHHLN